MSNRFRSTIGYVIGNDLSLVERYHELGARYITLSHGGHNDISDSARPRPEFGDEESEHDGISAFGERVIDHVDHAVDLIGIDHVGLSSDFAAEI